MPKIKPSLIRNDAEIRFRLPYTLQADAKELARGKKITLSELIRQLLQAEIDKSK